MQTIDKLVLINLLYAAADASQAKEETSDPVERADLEALLSLIRSPAGWKVFKLLLEKGCAYHVRGAWRFRGSNRRVSEATLRGLLAMGLAERVETDRCATLRITQIGRVVAARTTGGRPSEVASGQPRLLAGPSAQPGGLSSWIPTRVGTTRH